MFKINVLVTIKAVKRIMKYTFLQIQK